MSKAFCRRRATQSDQVAVETFAHDCDPGIQAQALTYLVRQNAQVLTQPVTAAAWHPARVRP